VLLVLKLEHVCMPYLRFSVVLGSVFLLLALISCSEPSGVGAGVGADSLDGGLPQLETVLPGTLKTVTSPRSTGTRLRQANPLQTGEWRFLAGAVTDYGRIEANGYVDFGGPNNVPDTLLNAPVDSLQAELRLQTEYVHGDTAPDVSFQLTNITEEVEMNGARADTSFPTSSVILTDEVSPTDSLVTFSLPQSWLRENISVLRDTSGGGDAFESNFHGFRLSAPEGQVVLGFDHGSAVVRLSLRNANASVDYPPLKSFSHIERPESPSVPEDRKLIRAGIGENLIIEWDAERIDSLRGQSLNDTEILIPVDPDTSSLEQDRGASFVRPVGTTFRLVGTRTADAPQCGEIVTFPVNQEGEECSIPLFPNLSNGNIRVDKTNGTASAIFQEILQSQSATVFSEYRLEVTDRAGGDTNPGTTVQLGLPSTIPVLIPTSSATDFDPPRVDLIITPL